MVAVAPVKLRVSRSNSRWKPPRCPSACDSSTSLPPPAPMIATRLSVKPSVIKPVVMATRNSPPRIQPPSEPLKFCARLRKAYISPRVVS
jgi:hypothetical protein